jgi:hypothetical protein
MLDLSDDVARFKKLGELGTWRATCTMLFCGLRVDINVLLFCIVVHGIAYFGTFEVIYLSYSAV